VDLLVQEGSLRARRQTIGFGVASNQSVIQRRMAKTGNTAPLYLLIPAFVAWLILFLGR
jgi:hypothetical protein